MTVQEHYRINGVPGGLDEALVHSSPRIRRHGRLVATGFAAPITAWAEDELERGADLSEVLAILLRAQLSVYASVAASGLRLDQETADILVELTTKQVADVIPRVFAMARENEAS